MSYEIRPISDPTRFTGKPGRPASFRADLNNTKKLLEAEVKQLRGRNLVVELDVEPGDITVSGEALKQYARPHGQGVVVAFESKHGPLIYATETFNDWRSNLRAIALSLQALRAVDRYGVTGSGEQYTGFAQITAGPAIALASHMTKQAAAELLERVAIGEEGSSRERAVERIIASTDVARETLRHARAMVHPDRNEGDRVLWDQIDQAAQVLGVAS